METKLETSVKGFHCFESEKLSLPINYYSTEIPKFQDVRAFLRFTGIFALHGQTDPASKELAYGVLS